MSIRSAINAMTEYRKHLTNLDTSIPILIALAAFFAAGAAWRASWAETETTASHLRALQQYMQQTMQIQRYEWLMEQDLRFVGRYQAHIRAWRLLEGRAGSLSVKDPLRESVDRQAQGELALARALQPFFWLRHPDSGDKNGDNVSYDGDRILEESLKRDLKIRGFDPALMEERAAMMHAKTLVLLGVVVLFVAALLLLTLAELLSSPGRRWWANVGGLLIVAGVAGAILAESVFR